MKYSFLFIALFSYLYPTFAQSDFRNVRWGMSIDSVKQVETSPLTKESKILKGYKNGISYYGGIELRYDDVTVAGRPADLTYQFSNGRLIQIDVVFKNYLYINYDDSISLIIKNFTELYVALERKGFKYTEPFQCGNHPYLGPDFTNPDNRKLRSLTNWNNNPEALRLIEKMVNEKRYPLVFFRMANSRSMAIVCFATKYDEFKNQSPVTLELTPNSKLKEEIQKSDF